MNHTGICWSSSIPFSEVHLARQGALLYPSQQHNLLTQVLARARVAGCSLWEEHSERRYSRYYLFKMMIVMIQRIMMTMMIMMMVEHAQKVEVLKEHLS